jgi:pyrroline-5-carboxylate reductase
MNTSSSLLAFIGGGNMASAIIGGLIRSGTPTDQLLVIEPWDVQRDRLRAEFGIEALAAADERLARAGTVVWAVKPQSFAEAAAPCAGRVGAALHLSVMAGIRSDAIARATGSERVVRAMPNTPALIGQGITGLYARADVTPAERERIQALLAPTGSVLWVEREADLDAVTALSGSGPAYVFYFVEAMVAAAERMGLSAEQGKQLALATFTGAAELARRSPDSPATLRERVTSKGGTTYAALCSLEASGVAAAFIAALDAARQRARELGDEFGR